MQDADGSVRCPRRILAVGLEAHAECLRTVIQDLTGSQPPPASQAHDEETPLAGSTHILALQTRYYKASVPMWVDVMASPPEWAASFLSEEAREVLAVLGGVVVVFAMSAGAGAREPVRELIAEVGRVVGEGLGGWEWDGVRLAVGVAEGDAGVEVNADADAEDDDDEWDELCAGVGLEFVRVGGGLEGGRNEFGEKTGIARVKEALESNDWAQADEQDIQHLKDGHGDDASDDGTQNEHPDADGLDFGLDPADMEGLRRAIWPDGTLDDADDGEHAPRSLVTRDDTPESASLREVLGDEGARQDREVARVEDMMRKLVAVRDAGEGMPEGQRRRMAARAVHEVMRELS